MSGEGRAAVASAAGTVCETIRTALGPFGATKLVISDDGTVTTTSSGSVALDRLDVDHPSATLLQAAAEGFRDEHGDGGCALVALTGALLDEADGLTDRGLHPTAIERGYRRALDVAADRIDRDARPVSTVGTAAVARTALTATRDPNVRQRVGDYLARVAATLGDESGGFDPRRVKVLARPGGAMADTDLVGGVVLDDEPVAEGMVRRVDGGVVLLSSTVDMARVGTPSARLDSLDVSLDSESFEDRAALGDSEREAFRETIGELADAGCRFLATSRAVNDRVKTVLANHGVLAVQRVDDEDLELLARATGASVVPRLSDAVETDAAESDPADSDTENADGTDGSRLGTATATVRRKAGRDVIAVESDAGEPVYTVFCRAPDPRSVDAFERSVESALASVARAQREGTVVPAGGAVEMSAERAVRERARSVSGRERLAMEAFADALTVVPRTLAENAGGDGWTAVIRLRTAHADGRHAHGVDATTGATGDVTDGDPAVEPTGFKRATLSAATDLAVKLVRIDDVLPATELNPERAPDELPEGVMSGETPVPDD